MMDFSGRFCYTYSSRATGLGKRGCYTDKLYSSTPAVLLCLDPGWHGWFVIRSRAVAKPKTESGDVIHIHRSPKDADNPFARISNEVMQHPGLSLEARGLMGYLLSHTDGWQLRYADIKRQSGAGVRVIRRVVKELEALGYIERRKVRGNDGRFTYSTHIYETPTSVQNVHRTSGHLPPVVNVSPTKQLSEESEFMVTAIYEPEPKPTVNHFRPTEGSHQRVPTRSLQRAYKRAGGGIDVGRKMIEGAL